MHDSVQGKRALDERAAARFGPPECLRRVAAKRRELFGALRFDLFQSDLPVPQLRKISGKVEVPFAIDAIQARGFLGQLVHGPLGVVVSLGDIASGGVACPGGHFGKVEPTQRVRSISQPPRFDFFLGNAEVPPSFLVILLFRWLAFRLEFGAGLIKVRGDQCWRDLTCLDYHHETQPMPNPLSWFFHHLPRRLHRVEVLGNFFAQLLAPWGLFLPQPVATFAALVMIVTQLYLVVSGNYAWLNWLTIVAIVAAFADPNGPSTFAATPVWFSALVLLMSALVIALSRYPVLNMASPRQAMNASFDALRLVNTYGAFGSVGRERIELVVEGSDSPEPGPDTVWHEYGFKGKPDNPKRLPPQVAPYHPRLDWLLWFIPISPAYGGEWFIRFIARLLQGDRQTLALLRHNPFPNAPPRSVRVRLFRYRFSTWRERRELGAWWIRAFAGEYLPPVRLEDLRRVGI